MGTDVRAYAERRENGVWVATGTRVFGWSTNNCEVFSFLADIFNRDSVPCISRPRGIPIDVSVAIRSKLEEIGPPVQYYPGHDPIPCIFGESWLSIEELLAYDYTVIPPYFGFTLAILLSDFFFTDLARLKAEGAERIVFWFDN